MRIALASGTFLIVAFVAAYAASAPRQLQEPGIGAVPTKKTAHSSRVTSSSGHRKIPCKTPENAPQCYWMHGRLSVYNGNPTFRIWQIGTHHILGVFNGSSHYPALTFEDTENPEFP